jgi:NAD(P)-dependent dehydrogenase (short-subunit alcohol dehydrogenase family)
VADAGDPDGLRAAVAPLFARPGAPGVVIYSAALMAPDDLLSVTPEQLAAAYAVNVIGAVVTAQLAVPAMRAAGGGTLLFTGGGFADALPESLATLSLGKLTLRGMATMLARKVRDDDIHAGSLTILGQIAAGTPFDPIGSPTPIGRSATRTVPPGVRNIALTAPTRLPARRGADSRGRARPPARTLRRRPARRSGRRAGEARSRA